MVRRCRLLLVTVLVGCFVHDGIVLRGAAPVPPAPAPAVSAPPPVATMPRAPQRRPGRRLTAAGPWTARVGFTFTAPAWPGITAFNVFTCTGSAAACPAGSAALWAPAGSFPPTVCPVGSTSCSGTLVLSAPPPGSSVVEAFYVTTVAGVESAPSNVLAATLATPACGDVNADGAINVGDALLIAQLDVGLRACATLPRAAVCDVNQDAACNIGDALRVAQCDVGLIPCSFACSPFACPLAGPRRPHAHPSHR